MPCQMNPDIEPAHIIFTFGCFGLLILLYGIGFDIDHVWACICVFKLLKQVEHILSAREKQFLLDIGKRDAELDLAHQQVLLSYFNRLSFCHSLAFVSFGCAQLTTSGSQLAAFNQTHAGAFTER